MALMVSGILTLCYFLLSHQWIRIQVQESLLCADQLNATSECREQLIHHISTYLPLGELSEVDLEMEAQQITAALRFLLFNDIEINERQTLLRPLQPTAALTTMEP